MLRQDTSRLEPDREDLEDAEVSPSGSGYRDSGTGIDIQRELNRIEEIIFDSLHIPLTRLTLIDEEQLIAQLNVVRLNLPEAFNQAQEVIRQREAIIMQAEAYAQEIIAAAERRADELIDEMGLVQQAQIEARQIRQQAQLECNELEDKTYQELELRRLQAQQEFEEWREAVIAECEEMQEGAQEYAEGVLSNIEQQLGDMLRIIRNGRQQIHRDRETSLVNRRVQQRSPRKSP
jgi:hypothetical protein